MSPRAVPVLAVLLGAAGCSCGGPAVPLGDARVSDAPGADTLVIEDAPYPDAPPGPELCTDGIRRVDVLLPAVAAGSNPDGLLQTSRSFVGVDEVLASRVDQLGNAQFARIDPRDGHVRAVGVGTLPSAVDAAQAFRRLDGDATDVLFRVGPALSSAFIVATFDASASFVSSRAIEMPIDPDVDELQEVVGAIATQTGFVVLARGQSRATGSQEAVLVDIRDAGARLERIGVPWSTTTGGIEGATESLSAFDTSTGWIAVGAMLPDSLVVSGVIVGRFDANATPFAPTVVSLPIERGALAIDSVRIDAGPDGTALLGVTTPDRLVLAWIAADLSLLGQWSYPLSSGFPPELAGSAGPLTDQAILLRVDDEIRLARGFGPGVVAGGLRPLLDGLPVPVDYFGPHDDFGPLDSGYVLATWTPNLSIVTFCEGL